MEHDLRAPSRLYKYRDLNPTTLEMLVENQHWFSIPDDFNDPMDAHFRLSSDGISLEMLRDVAVTLIEERLSSDLVEISTKIDSGNGLGSVGGMRKRAKDQARNQIDEFTTSVLDYSEFLRFHNVDCLTIQQSEERTRDMLRNELLSITRSELKLRQEVGALCLSERLDCPLMWSHYGGQHKGICLGYSISNASSVRPKKVDYGGSTTVSVRDVNEMLAGNTEAQERVNNAVFFTKAVEWSYEKEWRILGDPGLKTCDLKLEEVVFGFRCSPALRYVIAKILSDAQLFQNTIKLKKISYCDRLSSLICKELDQHEKWLLDRPSPNFQPA